MRVRKAYKFKLKPTEIQKERMDLFAGHTRFLWNKVLGINLKRLENKLPIMWYLETDYWSKLWKESEEYGFLKDCPAHCLQQKLKDLDKAFREAFDKGQPLKRIPTFKRKSINDSFRFPDSKQITIENRRIKLPKIGWIRFIKSRNIEGTLKNITISKSAVAWYISIQVELEIAQVVHLSKKVIGIDVGISNFAALSDGQNIDGIGVFKKHSNKLAKAQSKLSKKKRFSINWRKQKERISKLHSRIANIRRDFLHKTSTMLSKNHAMIVVEGLKIKNMSKSASRSVDNPGKNVKAKSGLNKSILDQGWGEFKRQLEYKMMWLGGVFLKSTSCIHKSNL